MAEQKDHRENDIVERRKPENAALRKLIDNALSGVSKEVRERSYAVLLGLITLPPGARIHNMDDVRRSLQGASPFEAVLMDGEIDLDQPSESDVNFGECDEPIPTAAGLTIEGENCLSYPFRGVILRLDGQTSVSYPFRDSFELRDGVLLLADYNEDKQIPADIHITTNRTDADGNPVIISAVPDYSVSGKKRIAVSISEGDYVAIFHSLIGDSQITSQAFESFLLEEGKSIAVKLPAEQNLQDGGVILDASIDEGGDYYGAVTPTPPASCSFSSLPYNNNEQQVPEGAAIIIGFALFLRHNKKERK